MFDFTGITISGNQYAPGFSLRANTASNMAASEVAAVGDGVLVNEDNIGLDGVPMSQLDPALPWLRADSSRWSAVDKNTVAIKAGVNGLWAGQNVAANMLVKKATSVGDAEIMVKVSGAAMSQYEESGVMFHGDDDNYVALRRKQAGGAPAGSAAPTRRSPTAP